MTQSRSARAVEWLRENAGKTLRDAAKKFHVSHQAIQQKWTALNLGPTPALIARAARVARITQLAAEGKTVNEIAQTIGSPGHVVRHVCRANDIAVTSEFGLDEGALLLAIDLVGAGGSIAQAALIVGITHNYMARILRRRGLGPGRARSSGKRTGLSKIASELVDAEGISVTAAAARVGVSPPSVHNYRRARGLK